MEDNKKNNILLNEIKELHASILEISKTSFEVKKLCITTIGIFNGFLLSKLAFNDGNHSIDLKLIYIAIALTISITILFHIIDATTYYYQRKNRKKQMDYKNEILISEDKLPIKITDIGWKDSIFNVSMSMYLVLYGMAIIVAYMNECNRIFIGTFVIYCIVILTPLICKKFKKTKGRVFVSYTTRDNLVSKGYLKHINYIVTQKKYTCYIDLLHNDSINKQEKVYRELLSSDIFLKISSDNYNCSEWTKKELSIALDIGKNIVTINHDDSDEVILNKISGKFPG